MHKKYKRWRPRVAALLWASVLILPGCATTGAQLDQPDQAADIAELIANGDHALRKGNQDQAMVEYVKALVEEPDNPDVLYKIATAHRNTGNLEVAERAFKQMLTLRPGDSQAAEGLGLVYLEQRNYAAAREQLLSTLSEQPDRWAVRNALGIIADLEGNYVDAQAQYTRALEISPNSTRALNNLGYSYYLSAQWPAAERNFLAALASDKHNKKAWSNLALLYVRQQNFQQGLSAFMQIMDKAEALNSVGYVCMLSQQYACAQQYFSRAIAADPVFYTQAQANLVRVRALISAAEVEP